jgi:multidrug efflux system outer membrane protein
MEARQPGRSPTSVLPLLVVPALALSVALLSGCAIGPNYKRPPVDTPPAYRSETPAAAPADSTSLADLPWWEVFQDPALKGLIEESLTNSYDIRIVAARVEQARYAVGVTRADLLPQVGMKARRARTLRQPARRGQRHQPILLGAFQMAWEIDIWGRIRRATEVPGRSLRHRGCGAASSCRWSAASRRRTRAARADLELEIANRTSTAFQQSLDLFTQRLRGGVGNKLANVPRRGCARRHAGYHPRSRTTDRRQGEPDQHPAGPQPGTDRRARC